MQNAISTFDDVIDALAGLHTQVIDARKGLDEAARLATGADITALLAGLRDMHARHAEALAAALAARGATPDADGSFMATVHRAVVNLRAAVGGLDEAALPAILDGEERLIDAYDEALEAVCHDAAASALVLEQSGELDAGLAPLEERARPN